MASSWHGDTEHPQSVGTKGRVWHSQRDVSVCPAPPIAVLGPAQPSSPPTAPRQPPHQDERDHQRQPRQPQPLRLFHPGAPHCGPQQAARHGPPKYPPGAPHPLRGSIPPAREGAGPQPQDPQAQRHWPSHQPRASQEQGGQPQCPPPRGSECPSQTPGVHREVSEGNRQQEERGREGGGAR